MLDRLQAPHASAAATGIALFAPRTIHLYPIIKRGFDVGAVVVTSPLTLVLVGAMALLVRLDGGPAFYRQQRLGKDGRIFSIWKLRSMVPNAEQKLRDYLESNLAAKHEWTKAQKLRQDPRITWIGKYLRKYSLDELPQLFNVLRGDMSLIGPRPICVDQRRLYPGTVYYRLRPGLTGLWQVNERNNCSFAERAGYDGRYAAELSFSLDMRILSKTALIVTRGTGL
jgi:lipopolysaccharide/colanic/teichoic acid biosynthesis glycosyltransferase